jgi:hypothetical protein
MIAALIMRRSPSIYRLANGLKRVLGLYQYIGVLLSQRTMTL